jgi:hypothetical protein
VEDAMLKVKQSTLWDAGTTILGDTSSMMGAIKDFVDFQESAETIQKIRDSLQAWRANPSAELAEKYLKNLRGLTNLRVQKIADTLGAVGKVVDVTDAVMTGLKTAQERGYKGMDKALTLGAEVVKKDLAWLLTKNPAVGLADFATGKVTTYLWGKDKSWTISNTIDRGSKAWDQNTQEYAGYTGGSLLPDGSGGLVATDAKIGTQDNFLSLVHRIKGQVESGKLDRTEAGARIRKLRDMMDRGGE